MSNLPGDNDEGMNDGIPEPGDEDDMEDMDVDGVDRKNPKKRTKRDVAIRSAYWEHFDRFVCDVDKIQKARCKYCKREIKADPKLHGTKGIKNHYALCKLKPHDVETNQSRIRLQPNRVGEKEGTSTSCWSFDQEKAREALCHWLNLDDLPSETIENPGFKYFMSVACPMFKIPSRSTIAKDVDSSSADLHSRSA